MKLYIVRHSNALNIGEEGIRNDEERFLSPKGRKRAEMAGKALRAMGCDPEIILTSPLARALETAEILAGILRPGMAVEPCDGLRPGALADDVAKALGDRAPSSCLLSGHAPDVTDLTCQFLGQNVSADIHFGKAAVACLTFEDSVAVGDGCLEWLMQPEQLRRIR